jgi:hypothetical protein
MTFRSRLIAGVSTAPGGREAKAVGEKAARAVRVASRSFYVTAEAVTYKAKTNADPSLALGMT